MLNSEERTLQWRRGQWKPPPTQCLIQKKERRITKLIRFLKRLVPGGREDLDWNQVVVGA